MPYKEGPLPQKDYTKPGVDDVYHATNVYANGELVALWNPPSTAGGGGGGAGGGPAGVPGAAGVPGVSAADADLQLQDEDQIDAPAGSHSAWLARQVAAGNITQEEADRSNADVANDEAETSSNPGAVDNSPPGAAGKGQILDYSRFRNTTSFPDSFVLTPRGTTLGQMTTQAQVSPQRAQAAGGLTIQQIVFNLANLAHNVYEPVKARYPSCIVGNTFRSSGTPQHGQGMAIDLKFRGMRKQEYINVARWVRDNIPFDQLIMENSVRGDMWIHCSFYAGFGRKKNGAIGYMINGSNYKQGLKDLSYLSHVRAVPTA